MYPLNCLISAAISSLVMDSGSAGASSSSSALAAAASSEAAFLAAFFPAAKCAMECFVFVAEPPNRATPSCVEEEEPPPAEDNLYCAADLPATNDPEHANATMPRPYATFLSDIDDDDAFFESFFCKSVAFSMSETVEEEDATVWYVGAVFMSFSSLFLLFLFEKGALEM